MVVSKTCAPHANTKLLQIKCMCIAHKSIMTWNIAYFSGKWRVNGHPGGGSIINRATNKWRHLFTRNPANHKGNKFMPFLFMPRNPGLTLFALFNRKAKTPMLPLSSRLSHFLESTRWWVSRNAGLTLLKLRLSRVAIPAKVPFCWIPRGNWQLLFSRLGNVHVGARNPRADTF